MKSHVLRSQRSRGLVTLIGLAVIAFVFVLAFSAADGASQMAGLSINETLQEKARLGAEAGLNDAISQLKSNQAWSGFGGPKALPQSPDVTYTVTVTNNASGSTTARAADGTSVPPGMVYLQSRGAAGSRTREVAVMLTPGGVSPFSYAIFGSTSSVDLSLSNGAAIDSYNSANGAYGGQNTGSEAVVGGNGNIVVSGGAKIDGIATAGPTPYAVQVSQGGKVSGATSSASRTIDFPAVDATVQTPNMNLTGVTVSGGGSGSGYNATTGDLTVTNGQSVTLASGTYYFRNITVNGGGSLNVSGPVVIYTSGVMNVSNGGRVNNSTQLAANLQIYSSYASPNTSTPGVTLSGGSDTFAAIYAPRAGFVLSNGGHIYGSLVVSSVSLAGGSRIHYDTALKSATPAYYGGSAGGGAALVVSGWDRR